MSAPKADPDVVEVQQFTIFSERRHIIYRGYDDLSLELFRGRYPDAKQWVASEGPTLVVEMDFEAEGVHHVTLESQSRVSDLTAAIEHLTAVRDHLEAMEALT